MRPGSSRIPKARFTQPRPNLCGGLSACAALAAPRVGGRPTRRRRCVSIVLMFPRIPSKRGRRRLAGTRAAATGPAEQVRRLAVLGEVEALVLRLVADPELAEDDAQDARGSRASRPARTTAVMPMLVSCSTTCWPQVTPSGSAKGAMKRPVASAPQVPPIAVDAEDVEGVVVAEGRLQEGERDVADSTETPTPTAIEPIGVTKAQAGVIATRPGHRRGGGAEHRRLPAVEPLDHASRPRARSRSRCSW